MTADFLVIGGGVVGLSSAWELQRRHPDARVVLLEKESACGTHASGRNSGVLHAGFYYSPDSLKAKLTRLGNRLMTEYCESRALPINRCGKLVVARGEDELPALEELLRRGRANGVTLRKVSEAEAREIEPRAKTFESALFSPTTASVDPALVLAALRRDAEAAGVRVLSGVRYLGRSGGLLLTSAGPFSAGFVLNCAGLYADRIARDFGFSRNYRILPFKGLYLHCDEPPGSLRVHIYPVPDLRAPFLGVHLTVLADGRAKIGPTALPALWRENYGGAANFRLGELAEILWREARLFATDGAFRRLALAELRKQSRRHLVALASTLASGIDADRCRRWGKPGIRAQLLDINTGKLEMDFVLEGDKNSLHVLNAVSPAFTCAPAFARYVCDRMGEPSPAAAAWLA